MHTNKSFLYMYGSSICKTYEYIMIYGSSICEMYEYIITYGSTLWQEKLNVYEYIMTIKRSYFQILLTQPPQTCIIMYACTACVIIAIK